jgi:hypothetical protein
MSTTPFTIEAERQSELRALDIAAAEIQRELGALEIQYLATRSLFLTRYEQNRQAYNLKLEMTAKEAGLDLTTERWQFDASTMTFQRL